MNFNSHISTLKKALFFVLGLLVAAFVVTQEVIEYHCNQLVQTTEQSDDADSDDQNEVVYELTCEVMLPAGTDLLKPFTPIFIRKVIRESEETDFYEVDVPLHDTPHYKTLFRQVIAPNAP
jgi:hypothetical protein